MNKYKIILSLFVVGLVLSSCEPNKAVYEELDSQATPYSKAETYTLSAADYSTMSKNAEAVATTPSDTAAYKSIASLQSLNNTYKAEDYIPAILSSVFKALGKGSSAMVTYNNFADDTFGDIETYSLSNADYTTISGKPSENGYFTPTASPQSYLPGFLKTKFPDAAEKDYILVSYLYPDAVSKDAMLFFYTGTKWKNADGVTAISGAGYEQMGNPGPGQYGNFSSDFKPVDYLPLYLAIQFPYDKDGATRKIAFKYYGGSNGAYVANATKENGHWNVGTSSQFINNGEKWIFDPTVNYEITSDDYQYLVDYVKNSSTLGAPYLQEGKDDREFYFGANSKYVNFNVIPFYRTDFYDPNNELDGMSEEQVKKVILDRINEAAKLVLEKQFPNSEALVNGIPVYYELFYKTYGSGNISYTVRFLCTGAGEFELQEGQPVEAK